MKWLNSLDELLYEVMSWVLFFPATLWRAAVSPFRLMEEIGAQASLPDDEQYDRVLSPPLFLALALLLAHALATALGQTDAIIANKHGLAAIVDDNTSALVLRVIIFAAFPLFLASRYVRAQQKVLGRRSLRIPFYEQCYPTATCALGLSAGTSLTQLAPEPIQIVGVVLLVVSSLYYVVVEVGWFSRSLQTGFLRASGRVLLGLFEGAFFLLFVGFLFTR